MKQFTFSILLLLTTSFVFAQNDSVVEAKKQVPNLATIHTTEGRILKGWFYKLDDEHVFLLPAKNKKFSLTSLSNPNIRDNTINIDVSQIQSISLRKKTSVLKGTLIGLGIGALTGIVAGLASGDDPVQPYYSSDQDPIGFGNFFVSINNAFAMTASQKAVAGGILLGGTGAIVGGIIGAIVKKKFIIGGKKKVYRDLQGDLMKRLLIQ